MSLKAHPDTIETKTGQTPRKVGASYFLSLDGVAEAPDRFITAWDDETDASGANLIATQDAVILGRRSYDEWAEFWLGSEIQPFRVLHQRRSQVRRHVDAARTRVGQLARDRRRAGRFRAAPEGSAGRRYRRPRQHFGHSDAACCRPRRRAQAHHCADDRRERATTVRRVADHTARDDP
jgi:hypothetical protein